MYHAAALLNRHNTQQLKLYPTCQCTSFSTASSEEDLLDFIAPPVCTQASCFSCAYISIIIVPTSSISDMPAPAAAVLAPLLTVFLLVELVELLPAPGI